MESIDFLANLTGIEDSAFEGCASLRSAQFGAELDSIYGRAFAGCVLLDGILLPDSLTYVGLDAFEGTAFLSNPDNWTGSLLFSGHCLLA
ncbi:MAG: leucine-rich repeat protein, partial [Clostridia bacterium]|nr:leucine-rich repeat protein [Clostridia bacterium]